MGAGNHEDIGPERIYAIAKSSPPLLSWLVFSRHCDLWLALRCSCRAWRQAAARINLNLTPKQLKLQQQPNSQNTRTCRASTPRKTRGFPGFLEQSLATAGPEKNPRSLGRRETTLPGPTTRPRSDLPVGAGPSRQRRSTRRAPNHPTHPTRLPQSRPGGRPSRRMDRRSR